MKNLVILMLIVGGFTLIAPVVGQSTTTVIETSSHSVFTGLFKSVWARLKSLNPTQKQSAKSVQTYTAGIRGAESTDTLLKPYWKDDLTQDEKFQLELQMFSLAQHNMDKGELDEAVKSFSVFLSEFGKSNLRPNALFGKSVSLAGLGQNQKSLNVMKLFIEENPNHPLITDARQVIAALQ